MHFAKLRKITEVLVAAKTPRRPMADAANRQEEQGYSSTAIFTEGIWMESTTR
jgi:hypothetical protein